MAKVTILGAGEFGTALEHILNRAGHHCTMWDVDERKMSVIQTMESALHEAEIIIAAVPSWVLRECLTAALPFISPHAIVVSIAKGLERETGATTDSICDDVLGSVIPHVYLSGPMLAEELLENKPAGAVLASANEGALARVRSLLQSTPLRVETSTDVRGVVLCGVLKNVYTIGAGMLAALELGDNARGTYVAVALREMAQQCVMLAGTAPTVYGIAGLGDFVATSAGTYSRNFTFGYTFAKDPDQVTSAEGAASYESLVEKLGGEASLARFPLLAGLIRVLHAEISPATLFNEFYN
jgi:glycerol-3-phosphate dehydrogenase (NAD(P)+)